MAGGATVVPLPAWLDIAGVAVFALTGALAAARERQTFVTMAFFALITGVGGGTLRDLMIGAPVFWIRDGMVAATCLAVATLAWFTPTRLWEGRALDIADALGLTAYAVIGSAKALAWGVPPIPAFVMGVVTGCAGGIIRDVIAGRPSILMLPELYVTAAALAAALTVAGAALDLPTMPVWIAATLAGFALRTGAILKGWRLPGYGRV